MTRDPTARGVSGTLHGVPHPTLRRSELVKEPVSSVASWAQCSSCWYGDLSSVVAARNRADLAVLANSGRTHHECPLGVISGHWQAN